MKKVIIGVAVLAVILGGGYWFLTQRATPTNEDTKQVGTSLPRQQDSSVKVVDTTSWATHEQKQLGYEVKYPGGAKITSGGEGVGIWLASVLHVPESLEQEKDDLTKHIPSVGLGVGITIDNPTTKYTNPCIWYYAERDNNILSEDDPLCDGSTQDDLDYFTTFAGIPAYVHARNTDGTDGGLYAVKSHTIVFFHDGRPWEIHYNTLPDNPTDKWKSHPYYTYLERSVPITQAILESFKFISPQ